MADLKLTAILEEASCEQCRLYRETIIQMLIDEEKKISNRIKYFNSPLEISRDELLAKYKYQLDDVTKRKKRFKDNEPV